MTPREKSDLILKGMEPALVTRVSTLGWTYKQTLYLAESGLTSAQIDGCLNAGASYQDIKKLVRKKQVDNLETTLFGKHQPIISDMPSLQDNEALKTATKICENTVRYGCWGIFKLGRLIARQISR